MKVYKEDGKLDPELWSAELVDSSRQIVNENNIAKVVGIKGIILLVDALVAE